MSKKKFTDGLESIFHDNNEQAFQEDSPLFTYEARSARPAEEIVSPDHSGYHSYDDAEEEEEAVVEETTPEETNADAKSTKAPNRPLTGLDLLIRKTTEESPQSLHPKANQRKVPLIFDKVLLKKLKLIARMQKTHFRELISALLHNYVERYEREKGVISDQNNKSEE